MILNAPHTLSSAAATPPLGCASQPGGSATFHVWAPTARRVELHLVTPRDRLVPMTAAPCGYWSAVLDDASPGARYYYRLDGRDRPDPASRLQPEGVHGPSEVVLDSGLDWDVPGWRGLPLEDYVFYELHPGAFTAEGTLDAIVPCLDGLRHLGVSAIELMPLGEFPGTRNWGYDGVFPFAVHHAYGGPDALRRLVRACHERGLAVVLDVVYNHLGPEGNYLRDFGPYFTDRYRTPWGEALNFDSEDSDQVRRFFLENALYWTERCGVDALRLDAVHAIYDRSAHPFLQELAGTVHRRASQLGRQVHLIAESDLNDARLLRPPEQGGYGLDAQWADDFHHSVHVLLTGERYGYYADYSGGISQLARIYREGWAFSGDYSSTRRRRFGNSPAGLAPSRFVVSIQNHDQVGNRMQGDRLHHLVGPAQCRLAAAAMILSPFLPLLFMGEEYAEPAPFLYYVSHSDPELVDAVRRGRKQEFAAFAAALGEPPDPQDESSFARSKLNPDSMCRDGPHAAMFGYYRELLRLRRSPALSSHEVSVECLEQIQVVVLRRPESAVVLHFGGAWLGALPFEFRPGSWRVELDSEEPRWGGAPTRRAHSEEAGLAPYQALVYLLNPQEDTRPNDSPH